MTDSTDDKKTPSLAEQGERLTRKLAENPEPDVQFLAGSPPPPRCPKCGISPTGTVSKCSEGKDCPMLALATASSIEPTDADEIRVVLERYENAIRLEDGDEDDDREKAAARNELMGVLKRALSAASASAPISEQAIHYAESFVDAEDENRNDIKDVRVSFVMREVAGLARTETAPQLIAHPDKDGPYICCADGEGSHEFRICPTKEAVLAFYEEMCGTDSDGTVNSIRREWDDDGEWRNDRTHLHLKLYCATFDVWKISAAELAPRAEERES